MMKNLLLVGLGLIFLAAQAQAEGLQSQNPLKGTHKPDQYDYGSANDFENENVPHGLPLTRPDSAKCRRSYPIHIMDGEYETKRGNATKRGEKEEKGDALYVYDYYDFSDYPVLLGEDWTVTFMLFMHESTKEGQVLVHLSDSNGANKIELKIGSHGGEKKRGYYGEYTSVDLRVTPTEIHGGASEEVFITSNMYTQLNPYQWYHITASHKNSCNKEDSGLKLTINGEESYDSYLKGYESYDYAFIPSVTSAGKPFAREGQFLGMGEYYGKGFVGIDATFDCVDFYNKAVSDGEIDSLYSSAKRVIKKAGNWEYYE